MLRLDYIGQIRKLIGAYTKMSSSSPFDGSFKSLYRGKGNDFDDLREYVYGDDVKDIDWKSSARTNKLLVKRFVVERQHNVLIICDYGAKMGAHTQKGDEKDFLAIQTAGTIAYMIGMQGDTYAFLTGDERGCYATPFKNSIPHLDRSLNEIAARIRQNGQWELEDLISYAIGHFEKKMVIFVITDQDGISKLKEKTIRRATVSNDLLFIDIDDAYLFSHDVAYDMESKQIERRNSHSRAMLEAEIAERRARLTSAATMLKRYDVPMAFISCGDDIVREISKAMIRNGGGAR